VCSGVVICFCCLPFVIHQYTLLAGSLFAILAIDLLAGFGYWSSWIWLLVLLDLTAGFVDPVCCFCHLLIGYNT